MSRRAWFAFFLAMLLFSWGYIAWWVRCGLVEARMHCVYIGYEWGGSGMGPHLATIHAELTPMAEAELKYSYVIPKTSSMNLFPRPHSIKYSKVYIPLWLFLKSENNLRQDTRYIADEIYRSMGYKVKLYGDYHCNEIIKTAVIEDKGYKLIEYPPQWLREFMLDIAFFDVKKRHSKSCDWLCGQANRWWSHELTDARRIEYRAAEELWKIEVKAHKDGLRLTHPGPFGYYLKLHLGDRSPY